MGPILKPFTSNSVVCQCVGLFSVFQWTVVCLCVCAHVCVCIFSCSVDCRECVWHVQPWSQTPLLTCVSWCVCVLMQYVCLTWACWCNMVFNQNYFIVNKQSQYYIYDFSFVIQYNTITIKCLFYHDLKITSWLYVLDWGSVSSKTTPSLIGLVFWY